MASHRREELLDAADVLADAAEAAGFDSVETYLERAPSEGFDLEPAPPSSSRAPLSSPSPSPSPSPTRIFDVEAIDQLAA
jgi:hypothetical protein